VNETELHLTLAVNPYDRHVALADGSIQPEGIALQTMIVGQSAPGPYGAHRHSRMLKGGEFDYAELSLSSYLMARDRGAPFVAIPVFPRRLFSPAQMYVRVGASIASPADLVGKRVGLGTPRRRCRCSRRATSPTSTACPGSSFAG
jgi:4,5-dihydroxyphthalate decarboxylase